MAPLDILAKAITAQVAPGFAASYGWSNRQELHVVGSQRYGFRARLVRPDTLFDVASLTKVVVTTTLAMVAERNGQLHLDDPVQKLLEMDILPGVLVRHLLTHESGLPAYGPYAQEANRSEEVRAAILAETPRTLPGESTIYSCLNFVVLQVLLEKVMGGSLDQLAKEYIFQPLNMESSCFCPPEDVRSDCMPTGPDESWRTQYRPSPHESGFLQGEVHDPIAFGMGGISGNAGLFSNSWDLKRFVQAMIKGLPPFEPEQFKRWTTRQSERSSRALGWDTKSETGSTAGDLFGPRSFGHTGYTGTSIWVDPDSGIWAILLSNWVYPTGENGHTAGWRARFHDAVFRQAGG